MLLAPSVPWVPDLIASYLMQAQYLYLPAGRRQITRHAFTTLNKVNGESHTAFLLVNHSKTCPNRLQSCRTIILVSETTSNNKFVRPMPVFYLMFVLLMKTTQKTETKGNNSISGGKISIKTKNTKRHNFCWLLQVCLRSQLQPLK